MIQVLWLEMTGLDVQGTKISAGEAAEDDICLQAVARWKERGLEVGCASAANKLVPNRFSRRVSAVSPRRLSPYKVHGPDSAAAVLCYNDVRGWRGR